LTRREDDDNICFERMIAAPKEFRKNRKDYPGIPQLFLGIFFKGEKRW